VWIEPLLISPRMPLPPSTLLLNDSQSKQGGGFPDLLMELVWTSMVQAASSPPAATSQSCTLWSALVVITTFSATGLNSTYLRRYRDAGAEKHGSTPYCQNRGNRQASREGIWRPRTTNQQAVGVVAWFPRDRRQMYSYSDRHAILRTSPVKCLHAPLEKFSKRRTT